LANSKSELENREQEIDLLKESSKSESQNLEKEISAVYEMRDSAIEQLEQSKQLYRLLNSEMDSAKEALVSLIEELNEAKKERDDLEIKFKNLVENSSKLRVLEPLVEQDEETDTENLRAQIGELNEKIHQIGIEKEEVVLQLNELQSDYKELDQNWKVEMETLNAELKKMR
jgi:chromosome segregation ATPase